MSLSEPTFLPLTLIRAMPLAHKWDDWDPYTLLGEQRAETLALLNGVSNRAQIAFSIACAEWVIWRFVDLCPDRRPFDILEAAWAGEMTKDLFAPPQLVESEWQGPIRAPIDLSLVTILNTFSSTEEGAGQMDAAFAELIALHVLSNHDAFLSWEVSVLKVLNVRFPHTQSDREGLPIPREMMDPNTSVSEKDREELVRSFLASPDRSTNPYLRTIERGPQG